MGGNLYNLPRKPRTQYLEIEREVREYLDQKLEGQFRIPRFYANKPDFGDLDVLVQSRPDWDKVRLEIVADLGITQTKAIGHVFSTVYRELQTDFFTVPAQYLESTYNFTSFNDLGNFLGRICRRFNLKYGEHGLSYVYRRNDERYKKDLEITQDFARICQFLGLDFPAWQNGFASLETLFQWVTASPYFSVVPYLQLNGSLEKRSRDRTTVQKFIEYLHANVQNRSDFSPVFLKRHEYLPLICEAFPEANLESQIKREQQLESCAIQFAKKFNGQLVMRLRPDLRDRALGEFIQSFRASINDFETFILESDPTEIERRILER
jgi:hypothetical protein